MNERKITQQEQMVKDAWEFVRTQAKAEKMRRKRFDSLRLNGCHRLDSNDAFQVHISKLAFLCSLIGVEYIRKDWDGNASCDANYDIIYFDYHDVRFFELVDKNKENDDEME